MRINIMGSAPGWEDTPVNDGFIWSVNNAHLLRDVDVIFDIHKVRLDPKEEKDKLHLETLRLKDILAYMNEEIEGMPNVKRYPIEEIKKEFDTDYFGSGIDYIIAMAIYQGATEIHIYGVMMEKGSEYEGQKPSLEFWIGIAKGRRIRVFVHGNRTSILRTRNGLVYGYQTPQDWVRKYNPEQVELLEMLNTYEDTVCN